MCICFCVGVCVCLSYSNKKLWLIWLSMNICNWYFFWDSTYSLDVDIQLSMLHTMTWAFTQSVPTKIANSTRIPEQSSVTIVIPASKHHHLPVLSFYVFLLQKDSHCCLLFLYHISRAGVAQYMKTEWRVVAIFNVVLFVVLVR